jgi:signal transduction histidine kinase
LAAEISALSAQLRREVELQRILLSPEPQCGALVTEAVPLAQVVEELQLLVRRHPAVEQRTLRWPDVAAGSQLETDLAALLRVLLNMVLNALEATPAGASVHLLVEDAAEQIVFRVWNPGAIPPAVALRVFQRYFSTKPGRARGQGTFAIKLLGEGYLGGQVGFSSSESTGTFFWLSLPRSVG